MVFIQFRAALADTSEGHKFERITRLMRVATTFQAMLSQLIQNAPLFAEERLIAMVGVEDIIVVDTDDAILICSKDNTKMLKGYRKPKNL